MLNVRALTTVGALLTAGGLAHAVTEGMNTSPLGSRQDPGVQFTYWDFFTQTQVNPPDGTTYTFNGVANENSTLTGLSLTQGAAHAIGVQGSGLLAPAGGPVSDAYYSSTFPQAWTLTATPSIDVTTISFQIKTANVNESVMDQLFVPTLSGVGEATFYTGAQTSDEPLFGTFANYVIEYRWGGLEIAAGTPLEITFSMAGGPAGNFTRKPVDFVSLDVATVPEPGTLALLGLGTVLFLGFRCRRRS